MKIPKMLLTITVLLFASIIAKADPREQMPTFPDVPTDHWSYNSIIKMTAAGMIEGKPNGFYDGNNPMTRYEFATAMSRLLISFPICSPPPVQRYEFDQVLQRLTNLEKRMEVIENKLNLVAVTPTVGDDLTELRGDLKEIAQTTGKFFNDERTREPVQKIADSTLAESATK